MACVQIDLNNVCRTCKNEAPEMKSLYYRDSESGKENLRLDEMLMACTSVQVNNEDGLPKVICRACFVQLKNAYTFKELCEKTDTYLREYVQNLTNENIKEETPTTYVEFCSILNVESNSGLSDANSDNVESIKYECQSGESCEKDFSQVQVADDKMSVYECGTCSKAFFTLDALKSHEKLHTTKNFKCKKCDKSYVRMSHLRRHESSHVKRKMHVCKICNKTLTRTEHLKRHLATHLKEKLFGCSSCNRTFNRTERLKQHMPTCKGDIVYVCDVCNKVFNREDTFNLHKRFHGNTEPVLLTLEDLLNFKDYYMEIDFDDFVEFSDLSDTDDLDVCEETIEPEVEVSENNDQEKIDQIAQISNEIYEEDLGEMTEENVKTNDERWKITEIREIYAEEVPPEMLLKKVRIQNEMCKENDERLAEEALLEVDNGNDFDSDISSHSVYKPTKPIPSKKKRRGRGRPRKYPVAFHKPTGRPRGRPPIKLKMKQNAAGQNGVFPCPQCDEVFAKVNLLDKHAEQHENLKIHECDICNKKFHRYNLLKRHKLLHVEVKQKRKLDAEVHSCDLCMAVFTKLDYLTKHKALRHNIGEKPPPGEKKYKCEFCPKGFTTEKYRDLHMKAHLGEKKYECRICEKSYTLKSHLTEHMRFHNDSSKKFLCSECGQRFIRNDYLVIHMRRHRGEKPYKCKFCGKGFPRTTDLTVHERYHTGEKTHLCVICGRGFGRAYNLTVHMRTHTGEKPYRCTYCDAAFAQGNDLKAHVRRHTGERFQCELCPETFLMGYLLTQHKRVVHGLNIVSNIRRLQPVNQGNPDDPPPITVPLPPLVVVPSAITIDPLQIEQSELKHETTG